MYIIHSIYNIKNNFYSSVHVPTFITLLHRKKPNNVYKFIILFFLSPTNWPDEVLAEMWFPTNHDIVSIILID